MVDSAPEAESSTHPSWPRRHRRLLIVLAALLLLYTLGGFLLVPYVARNAIVDYVQKDLHRHAAVGEVDFNPWTMQVELHRFSLAEADDRPILSFDLLRVRAALLTSLLNRAWTLSEVRLDQPQVHAVIAHDGTLNLAQLAPPRKPEQPAAPPSQPPAVRIVSLGLHGGAVHFEDHSRSEPFSTTLAPIEFDLTDFRTQPRFENKYRFSAQTAANERLEWAGEFSVQPLGSDGEFTISALKVATLTGYLQDAVPCQLTGGSIDVHGKYTFLASPAPSVNLELPSIRLHGLGIEPRERAREGAREGASGTPWIALPELAIDDTRVSLEERRVAIGSVRLQGAAVQVWRTPEGGLNLQQLAASGTGSSSARAEPATPGAPAQTSSAAPWQISLDRLELADAAVDVEDRSVKPAFKTRLSAIGFIARDYSSAGEKPLKFDLRMRVGAGGQMESQGTVALGSLDSSVDFALKAFDLPPLQPYIAQAAALTLYRGRLGVKGHADYAAAPARGKPKLRVALALDVEDLATRDNYLHEELASWRELRIDGLRYQMAPDALSIDRILARGAYGRVVVGPQGKLNVTELMHPGGSPPAASGAAEAGPRRKAAAAPVPAKAASAAPGMPMKIARIEIEDSAADFTDQSIEPRFSTAIYNLKGSVVGLSSDPASRATIDLAGSVDRYAPVTIKGQLNLLSATAYTDISLDFSNIELPTFNPYSGKYAGYNIAQGKLTTQIHYHVENRKLDATHHIVIDQLEFGAATESKQAAPLPIKLAVSLLKDRNGVIDLNLPVGGSLDDPKFRIGPIIWKVFVNLIEKAVTAPFALLGSLFGGGPQLSYIDFPAGAATLTADQQQKLSQLAKALVERPALKLDIPLHTQADTDDAALERGVLDTALKAEQAVESGKGVAGTPDDVRLRALVALYHTSFRAEPEYPAEIAGNPDKAARAQWLEEQLLPHYAPSATQRDELGRARAEAVQSAVLANPELKPERVFLTNQASGGGPPGSVRMELKLE